MIKKEGTMLSVDPGTKDMGWALWQGDRMVRCGIARGQDWIEAVLNMPPLTVGQLFIEDQQIYRNSRINAHSLLSVARVVGAVVFYYNTPLTVLVLPRAWKGQLPKEVCGRRTISKLDPAEQAVLGKTNYAKSIRHNLIDAIGIGLWGLGRR